MRCGMLLFGAWVASVAIALGQGNASGALLRPGLALAAKIVGNVTVEEKGKERPLRLDEPVPIAGKVATGANSSVVVVFSNGATLHLGSDAEIVIEEFVQEPFGSTVKVSQLITEPSTSRTIVRLQRGEIVADLKKLRVAQGSEFRILTPAEPVASTGSAATCKVAIKTSDPVGVRVEVAVVKGEVKVGTLTVIEAKPTGRAGS